MNLLDLLLGYLISFLRWAFSITGRYSVARQQWEYGRYRSALAALSRYLFNVANAMVIRKRWLEYTHREMAKEKIQHPVNINVTQPTPNRYSVDHLDRLYDAQARRRRQKS